VRLENFARPESFAKVPEVVGQEFLDEVVLPEVVGVRGGERFSASSQAIPPQPVAVSENIVSTPSST